MSNHEVINPSSEVTEYFRVKSEGKDARTRQSYNRAGMALHRAGHTTLEAACALTDEQLARIRDVGAKAREIIGNVLEEYRRDKNV